MKYQKELAEIIKAFLDNGDNDMLDGIGAVDTIVREIAGKMEKSEAEAFLQACGLF